MRTLCYALLILFSLQELSAQYLVFSKDGSKVYYHTKEKIAELNLNNSAVERTIDINGYPLGISLDGTYLVIAVLTDAGGWMFHTTFMYWNLAKEQFDHEKTMKYHQRLWDFQDVRGENTVCNVENSVRLAGMNIMTRKMFFATKEFPSDESGALDIVRVRPSTDKGSGWNGYIRLDEDKEEIIMFGADNQEQESFDEHGDEIGDVCFSDDGKTMISAGKKTIVWNVETGDVRSQFENANSVNVIAFSKDAQSIGFMDEYGTIGVSDPGGKIRWSVNTGDYIGRNLGDEHAKERLRFSPNNELLLRWNKAKGIRIYNAKSGNVVYEDSN